jgi:replication-associated recombination protein RarA
MSYFGRASQFAGVALETPTVPTVVDISNLQPAIHRGKPGSGKSTLAKYLVKNLVQVPNASSSTVAHYFYTFRGTILESTHENMLRSILQSILEQDESAFFHFQQELRDFRVEAAQNGFVIL